MHQIIIYEDLMIKDYAKLSEPQMKNKIYTTILKENVTYLMNSI